MTEARYVPRMGQQKTYTGFGVEIGRGESSWKTVRYWWDIKRDLQETEWKGHGLDWSGLELRRDMWRVFVNAVMNLRVP